MVEGLITGAMGHFDCPLTINLFGPSDPVESANLASKMRCHGLPTEALQRRELTEQQRVKATQRALKNGKAPYPVPGGPQKWTPLPPAGINPLNACAFSSDQSHLGPAAAVPTQSLEDIIGGSERFNPRNVETVVEKFGNGEVDLVQHLLPLPMLCADYVQAAMALAQQPEGVGTELRKFQLQVGIPRWSCAHACTDA